MNILADENIPLVKALFGHLGDVKTLPAGGITAKVVKDADILLVRSVIKVNQALLSGSNVQFVGTATIGTDHIDQNYLHQNNIAFANAPGSNADSVVEWVLASILTIAVRKKVSLAGKTLGIVGCGQIGGRIARRLKYLGLKIMLNDPPLAEKKSRLADLPFSTLDALLAESDIVTCHVPLVQSGTDPTSHLINKKALSKMKKGAWLLNSGRGIVVDNQALLNAILQDQLGATMFDVWENEPMPSPELIAKVDLVTPHIAGYSVEGKQNGTFMLAEAVHNHLGIALVNLNETEDNNIKLDPPAAVANAIVKVSAIQNESLTETEWLHFLVRQMYDIQADDDRLRAVKNEGGADFIALRKKYPRRRTFSKFSIAENEVPVPLLEAVKLCLCIKTS